MLQTVHKNTVKKIIRRDGRWTGWLAPSNVNAYHVRQGWCLGCKVTALSLDGLEQLASDFQSWNCNEPELGHRVRFWQEA